MVSSAAGGRPFALFLFVYVAAWTLYACVTRNNLDSYGDMAENYAWGQEWQWGYHKHPPLFAWLPALWFRLLPTEDWAYFLFSYLNAAVGLIGVWLLARCFLKPRAALCASAGLGVTPAWSVLAAKFNANAILLSTWPWAAFAFYMSLTRRNVLWGAVFGVCAALAVLGKYFSLLLLAVFLLVSLLHKEGKRYWRSPSPYVALAVFVLVLSPHVWWALGGGFPTLGYVAALRAEEGVAGGFEVVARSLRFAAGFLLHSLPWLAVLALAYGWRGLRRLAAGGGSVAWREVASHDRVVLSGLVLGVPVLAILASLILRIPLKGHWLIPLGFAVGVALCVFACAATGRAEIEKRGLRAVMAALLGWPLVMLALSPLIAFGLERGEREVSVAPRREVAFVLSRVWEERFGSPLRIVAGARAYSLSVAFYAPSHPSVIPDFDLAAAPWISAARLEREGAAVVCPVEDVSCVSRGEALFGGRVEEFSWRRERIAMEAGRLLWVMPVGYDFLFLLVPPLAPDGVARE